MYKQSPSRNQRSKGIKVKNVIQICLLVAVCFWLIFQMKRSHDKKKEFEEHDPNTSLTNEKKDETLKLGRKDLDPLVDNVEKRAKQKEEEEEDDEEDEEEPKHEEQEKITEGINVKSENDTSLVIQKGDTREAREENYKADDASSAVTHDNQNTPLVNEAVETYANNNTLVKENLKSNSTVTEELFDQPEVSEKTLDLANVTVSDSASNLTIVMRSEGIDLGPTKEEIKLSEDKSESKGVTEDKVKNDQVDSSTSSIMLEEKDVGKNEDVASE